MRLLVHFGAGTQPLVIETFSSDIHEARWEIRDIVGKRPTSMSVINGDFSLPEFLERQKEQQLEMQNRWENIF
tara:strand:+ start:13256 stop:13474 length:219 start_codon:yes stop_codon:yes gene_type:complete